MEEVTLSWKGELAVLAAVVFDSMGSGLLVPLLPFVAIDFGATPLILGCLSGSFSLMQMLGTLILGRSSDWLGRRVIILVCLLGSSLCMLALSFASNLQELILFRCASGFFAGTVSVCQAYLADMKAGAHGMAKVGAAFGVGLVFGPAISGALADFGFAVVARVASGLAMVNFLVGTQLLSDPPRPAQFSAFSDIIEESEKTAPSLISILKETPALILLYFVQFMHSYERAVFLSILPLFLKDDYAFGPKSMGLITFTAGAVMIIFQGILTKPAIRLLGEVNCMVLGHTTRVLFFIGISVTHASYLAYFIPYVLFAASGGLITPSMSSMTASLSPARSRGLCLGALQSVASGAMFVGPLCGGALYSKHGHMPFVVNACVSALNVCLTMVLRQKLGTVQKSEPLLSESKPTSPLRRSWVMLADTQPGQLPMTLAAAWESAGQTSRHSHASTTQNKLLDASEQSAWIRRTTQF